MFTSWTFQIFRIKKNGHWAVIEQFHFHVFSEATRGHRQATLADQVNEVFAELIRAIWRGSLGEAGASSSATIRKKGKLAYHED